MIVPPLNTDILGFMPCLALKMVSSKTCGTKASMIEISTLEDLSMIEKMINRSFDHQLLFLRKRE